MSAHFITSENLKAGVVPGSDFRGGARAAYQQSGKFGQQRQNRAPDGLSDRLALCFALSVYSFTLDNALSVF